MNSNPKPYTFYFKIWFDDSDPLALVLSEEDLKGIDQWAIFEGKSIDDWPKGITFLARGQHVKDYLAGGGWVVISERTRLALERCRIQGVQFLSVQIVCKDLELGIGSYWVLNVTQVSEALDWKHTRWARPQNPLGDPHPSLNIIKEALLWDVVRESDVFLLSVKGKLRTTIHVSPRFKHCLEEAGAISGFKFIPIPVYLSA